MMYCEHSIIKEISSSYTLYFKKTNALDRVSLVNSNSVPNRKFHEEGLLNVYFMPDVTRIQNI
jgi:hypothetical protein